MDKKLKRSRNQIIAGVCAGFADYIGWDITLVRALYAVLTICTVGFPGIVLYAILWFIMPLEAEEL